MRDNVRYGLMQYGLSSMVHNEHQAMDPKTPIKKKLVNIFVITE